MSQRWTSSVTHVVASLVVLSACSSAVTIPPAGSDTPPVITVNGFVVGGSGEVSQENVSAAQVVSVSLGTELMISAVAKNPGGVKTLSLTVMHVQKTVSAVNSASPDAGGKVPDLLTILGTDGTGGAGNQPIEILETPASSPFPVPASVQVSATNFNGQTTAFTVTYDPFWKVPDIRSFVANPDYINIGSSSQLKWEIRDCAAYCQVSIEGRDGIGFKDLVEADPNRSAYGSLQVRPMRSTQTHYILTASNPNNFAASRTVTVTLAPSPPQPGQVFFLEMDNAASTVTQCFTMAIYAPDLATAKLWAEAQNGGYSATEITEAKYLAGC